MIGFRRVFTANANVVGKGNREGPIEPQLAVSRDLKTWQRPFRTSILPLGKPAEWDGGMIVTASQAIDVGDEVRLYYGGILVELVMELEEEFDVYISDEAIEKLQGTRDLKRGLRNVTIGKLALLIDDLKTSGKNKAPQPTPASSLK